MSTCIIIGSTQSASIGDAGKFVSVGAKLQALQLVHVRGRLPRELCTQAQYHAVVSSRNQSGLSSVLAKISSTAVFRRIVNVDQYNGYNRKYG